MNPLSSVRSYTRIVLVELMRTPGYVIPTVLFPALFYAFFAMPYATKPAIADLETLSYVAFAIVGVSLFQFGVGIAAERGRPWERYLRTLPMPTYVRFTARVITALIFGCGAAALVALVARLFTPVDLGLLQWLQVFVFGLIGGVPFVLFGIAIGYCCNARAALPIANIFYLLLSYLGGLWVPPQYLPSFAATISPYLPTRQFAELLWSVSLPGSQASALVGLGVYAAFFAVAATIGYRRDERTRYA